MQACWQLASRATTGNCAFATKFQLSCASSSDAVGLGCSARVPRHLPVLQFGKPSFTHCWDGQGRHLQAPTLPDLRDIGTMCLRPPQHERSCQLSLEQKLHHVWIPIVPRIQSPPCSFVVPLLSVRAPLDCMTVLKCSEFLSQLLATRAESSRGKACTLGRRGAQPAVNPSRGTCWRASPPDSPVWQWSGSQLQ